MIIAVLDIETTGLNFLLDKILEIGIVFLDLNNELIYPALHMIIKQNVSGAEWIFKHSSLLKDDVINAVSTMADAKFFIDKIKYPFVSYNTQFDFGFLEQYKIKPKTILPDPMILLTPIIKLKRKNSSWSYKWPKVQEALEFFKIEKIEEHRALSDATVEAEIILNMYKKQMYKIEV